MGNCQKSFGITICLLRLSRKLKQEQLAEKSGLSLRHIKSIERGLSDPTLSTLEKIASALSLRVKELFAREEIRRSPKGIGKDLENCKESELLRFYACNKILLSKYK